MFYYPTLVELSEKDLVEIVEYDMDEQGIYYYYCSHLGLKLVGVIFLLTRLFANR